MITGNAYQSDPDPMFADKKNVTQIRKQLEKRLAYYASYGMHREADIIENAFIQIIDHDNYDYMRALSLCKTIPVTITEFIESDEFLGDLVTVWPALKEELKLMAPDQMAGQKAITEILNNSAIGAGKSTVGQILTCYYTYFLTCFHTPQLLFSGLNQYTPLVFILQSVREDVTKRVLYNPIREMFTSMPYVQKYVEYDKDKESQLIVAGNIQLVPGIADPNAFIGQAVIGGHIDEANFMQVVQQSKKEAGADGQGGFYDQAQKIYRSLSRRRKSRFLTHGPNPGCLYISSSVHYKDDFLARRIDEVRKTDTHIKVLKLRAFEVQPQSNFSGDRFKFLVGGQDTQSRVIEKTEIPGKDYPEKAFVELVPLEYIEDFRNDPEGSQRDVLGIPSTAINRYITRLDKIQHAAMRWHKDPLLNTWVDKANVVLRLDKRLPTILADNIPQDSNKRYFVHVDLSKSHDRCGIAVVSIDKYVPIKSANVIHQLPVFTVNTAISIEPDKVNNIELPDVRAWVCSLKEHYGLTIAGVSFDGFNSLESRQILKKQGIASKELSVDRTAEAYELFRSALYQDRIKLYPNKLLIQELGALERKISGGKITIDHPPRGYKDIADAVVGACMLAAQDRKNRLELGDDKKPERPNPTRV